MNNKKRGRGVFCTTQWTIVMRARGDSDESREALGTLCEVYWSPVFEFLRREGRDSEDSQELTQEFFKRILDGGIGKVSPEKGRFRSYLLGALKHFLADRQRDEARIKRGGSVEIQSIESGGSDTSLGIPLPDRAQPAPDAFFDRDWALALIDRGLLAVQDSFDKAGNGQHFEVLKPWLMGNSTYLSQSAAAAKLDLSSNAVTVAIHRLRKSFRSAILAELASTVTNPDDLDEELNYLIKVLS
jgi:DNA-directed RNA polymerase specialized sigma24 family protein